MDGIAKVHPLSFRDVRIAGCLPELEKINLNVDVRLGEAGIFEVLPYIVPQLRLRWSFLKLTGAVQDGDFLVGTVMFHCHDLLRQFKERAVL